jgi:hypothetical protein
MQAAHFHFCRRDTPLSMLKIKFSPFSLAKLARSDKDQWRKLQSCFCQRRSVVILDGSEQRADTRWMTCTPMRCSPVASVRRRSCSHQPEKSDAVSSADLAFDQPPKCVPCPPGKTNARFGSRRGVRPVCSIQQRGRATS